MKTSTQLKALLRNLSKKANVQSEVLLRNFMLERFLERISLSTYKDCFILKGGMLITAMVGIDMRSTMDMDATLKGNTLTFDEVNKICKDIIDIDIDDGVELSLRDIDEILGDADYPGYRVSIDTKLDKTRQTIKIDITTGDAIIPKEIKYEFKLMCMNLTNSNEKRYIR